MFSHDFIFLCHASLRLYSVYIFKLFEFQLFFFCYEPSESGKCLTNLLLQNILDKKASFVLLNGLYVEIFF